MGIVLLCHQSLPPDRILHPDPGASFGMETTISSARAADFFPPPSLPSAFSDDVGEDMPR